MSVNQALGSIGITRAWTAICSGLYLSLATTTVVACHKSDEDRAVATSTAESSVSPEDVVPLRDDTAMTPRSPRLEPIAGWDSTQASVGLLRKIAAKEWNLGGFLSKERGLILIQEMHGPRVAKRYCGRELGEAMERAQIAFDDVLERIKYEGAKSVSCSNVPRPPRCRTTELGHQGAIFFRFADGERGLELEAIYTLSLGALSSLEGGELEQFKEATIAAADKAADNLSQKSCVDLE